MRVSKRRAQPGRQIYLLFAAPGLTLFLAFWLLPMLRLVEVGASGPSGAAAYLAVLTNHHYFMSLLSTLLLSAAVTVATLLIASLVGLFLQRNRFPGKAILLSMLTFPLAFPGVVVGFMVIMLAGRQGLIGVVSNWLFRDAWVFAYSLGGLFLGYLYFSIPRVILTVMAAAEKLDPALEEAARSLGANPLRIFTDVVMPALSPALISSGAICFATSVGAFGTAFTLATNIDVLPMAIYNEFTSYANFSMAAALSIVLGAVTWLVLAVARSWSGSAAGAAA
ncbi:binding--dependent transport system inner membrane component family protein [Collimonas arenae]|uniref:Binding--dependent transport system inner membrane component family protein n=1 Tax=Collimonas arenae TaxID=279058 RepID=A0A127QNG4_9BURK|nr:ABC transporter permease [Collimonas arenae]AMP11517.1 binding--dependent transport system inner membrane component family protein [Collimonas arenae]